MSCMPLAVQDLWQSHLCVAATDIEHHRVPCACGHSSNRPSAVATARKTWLVAMAGSHEADLCLTADAGSADHALQQQLCDAEVSLACSQASRQKQVQKFEPP